MKDAFGYTLKRGNTIAYASRQGSNLFLRRGRVADESDKQCTVEWETEYGYAPEKPSVLKTPGLIARVA